MKDTHAIKKEHSTFGKISLNSENNLEAFIIETRARKTVGNFVHALVGEA